MEKYQVGKADPVGVFRVFDVTAKGKPLAELATAGGKWAGGEAPSGISNGTRCYEYQWQVLQDSTKVAKFRWN